MTELPDLSTVKIKGNFNCSHNMLTSLRGAPKADIQGAVFDCGYNQITTLKHLPMRNVGEAWHWEKINCNDNRLKTLKDLDLGLVVECKISCANNQLERLELMPMLYQRMDYLRSCGHPIHSDLVCINDFSGNPCSEKYNEWLKKHSRGRHSIGVFELRDANAEILNKKNALVRGISELVNRMKFDSVERKIYRMNIKKGVTPVMIPALVKDKKEH